MEGSSPACEQDSLMIYDGGNVSASAFDSPYCERSGPTTLKSTRNSVYMRFVTDAYGTFSGFKIEYSAEPSECESLLFLYQVVVAMICHAINAMRVLIHRL